MKKILVAAAASLSLAAMPIVGAFAIDSSDAGQGDTTKDVKVGEVDETIYKVHINWGDMIFDWKYDENTKSFDFKSSLKCTSIGGGPGSAVSGDTDDFLSQAYSAGRLFTDDQCSTAYTGSSSDINSATTRYYTPVSADSGAIIIADTSENGAVTANVSFTAESDYSWTTGEFSNWVGVTPAGEVKYWDDMSDKPADPYYAAGIAGPNIIYNKVFHVKKASGASVDPQSVSTNDKIGTITINVAPVNN